MSTKIEQWFDLKTKKTKFRVRCSRCNRPFHACLSPAAAERAARRKGYHLDEGLCHLCWCEITKEQRIAA